MPTQDKIRRFALIIEKIKKTKYPSFDDIQLFLLKQDFPISHRTLQRDIEQIKYQLNISIEYDKKENGYFIEENTFTTNLSNILQQKSFYSDLMEFMQENPNQKESILIDNDIQQKGFEHIQEILSAIKQQRILEFDYQKFREEKPKKYFIEPYAIKEFDNRWYLVGLQNGKTQLQKFGIERIVNCLLTTKKFHRLKTVSTVEHFAQMIGINDQKKEREIIQIAFTPFQAKYVETLPLHWSQKEIKRDENWIIYEYYLIPNFELEQKILGFGIEAKVHKPIKLKNRIKHLLEACLKNYE